MKRILYLLIILTLASCRYFNVSPVNGISTKNLTEKPTQTEMIGIWEVDKFSYELKHSDKKQENTNDLEKTIKSYGKDSYEMRKAGAKQMLVASHVRWALMTEDALDSDPSLPHLLKQIDVQLQRTQAVPD